MKNYKIQVLKCCASCKFMWAYERDYFVCMKNDDKSINLLGICDDFEVKNNE